MLSAAPDVRETEWLSVSSRFRFASLRHGDQAARSALLVIWDSLHRKFTWAAARLPRVSRPVELHHRPLAEPSMRLSPHSAPIRQTCRSYLNGLPVARIEVLLSPVASLVRLPDPTPSLQPHYELSLLLRVGSPPTAPPQQETPRAFCCALCPSVCSVL